MEAIILAAGVGSRLGAAAEGRPKCLVPVAGTSILARQLDALRSIGTKRLIVVTGHAADAVRNAVTDCSPIFVHNLRYRETNVLHSWMLGSVELQDDHIYLHGDTVFERKLLERLVEDARSSVVLTVDRHACGTEEMKVQVVGQRVTKVNKSMPPSDAFGEFTGVMLVRAAALTRLRDIAQGLLEHAGGEKLFFEAALQDFILRYPDETTWVDVSDLRWREIDFEEDLEAAERMFR